MQVSKFKQLAGAAIAALAALAVGCGEDDDDESYELVLMPDGKHWMKRNLNVKTANSWCYNNSADNCAKYGRLYTWNAAMSACPSGWHLPSDAEWTALIDTVGESSAADRKLKATSGWNGVNGTDDYGFSALPGGIRYPNGSFNFAGLNGFWWSATENTEDVAGGVWGRYMFDNNEIVDRYNLDKRNGFSVRCVYHGD